MKMQIENLYQDIWIKGKLHKKGIRDCDAGYQILRELAQKFHRPFTVLDIGANYGYFSTRLAEEFDCCSVAVEPESKFAQRFFELNDNHKVILLKHEFTAKSLQKMAMAEHFDIVLAYGVIHWLPMEPQESFEAIKAMGDWSLIELPFEDDGQTVGGAKMKVFEQPPFTDYSVQGYIKSHLMIGRRKVILVGQAKKLLTRKHVYNETPIELHVEGDFDHKYIVPPPPKPLIDWVNGINLMTLIAYTCTFPTFSHIKQCLVEMEVPEHHGDIRPWNIIFDGRRCTLIDKKDEWPTSNDKRDLDLLLNCNSFRDLLNLRYNDKKLYT